MIISPTTPSSDVAPSGKRIIRLDASALKDSHCIRKLWLRVAEGYRGRGTASDIHYGTCFHYFAEEYERNPERIADIIQETQLKLYECPDLVAKYGKDYLDVVHLSRTCHDYVALRKAGPSVKWNNAEILRAPFDCEGYKKGDPLLEVKFSFPICVTERTEFLLQGTIDVMAKIRGGMLVLDDYKTTASKDIEAFFKSHKMSPQGRTYVFAVRQMAAANPNGLFGQLLSGNTKVGFRIRGIFMDPKLATRYEISDPFTYEDSELNDYYDTVYNLCRELELNMSLTDTLPIAEGTINDTCRSSFGSYCPYLDACANSGKIGRSGVLAVLDAHLNKKEYRPLEFGGGMKKQPNLVTK